MQRHHWVWLQCHPNRTKQWLLDRLADGFEIHHVDPSRGDIEENLVLIESKDHTVLHGGMTHSIFREKTRSMKPETLERGKQAYELRLQGYGERQIIGIFGRLPSPYLAARKYAASNNLPWPIKGKARPEGKPRIRVKIKAARERGYRV